MMSSKYKDLFKADTHNYKQSPYYKIKIEIDFENGDYIEDEKRISIEKWNELPDIVFLGLIYLNQHNFGRYWLNDSFETLFNKHWKNNDSFNKLLETFKVCGICVSSVNCQWNTVECVYINVDYFDEYNWRQPVNIPSTESLFKTEEEMMIAINDALDCFYDN